jgi:hypothetical protein
VESVKLYQIHQTYGFHVLAIPFTPFRLLLWASTAWPTCIHYLHPCILKHGWIYYHGYFTYVINDS